MKSWFARAQARIPGGVNSPVRAFKSVGGEPFFTARADGAYLWDVEGTRYIDYVGSWGPMILGHAHPEIIMAITLAAQHGTSFGAPTEREVRVARILMQVWLSSLNGWVCGVDGPERVDEDLEAAARVLLA